MYKNIKNEKTVFREKYKAWRLSLPPDKKVKYDNKIFSYVLETMAYKDAKQVLLYYSLSYEVETKKIFNEAIKKKKTCFYPRCEELGLMFFYEIKSFDDMEKGMFNLPEPLQTAPLYTSEPGDVCIVPALAYDEDGYRMGYGKGYYDRFLSEFGGTKIGICYSDNVEKRLPRGKYDVKVDILITEKGLYKIR